jgi:hypothetical protein
MKRIISSFKDKSSQPEAHAEDDQSSNTVRVEPGVDMSFDTDMNSRIESQGPGKNILMPDIYGNEHGTTVPDLKIIDPSSPDIDESTGFNPYDTAILRKK